MENPVPKSQQDKEIITSKLVEDIEGSLSRALEQSSNQRKAMLTTLFQDLSNKIKKNYQGIATFIQ
jgi:hypothetical protein